MSETFTVKVAVGCWVRHEGPKLFFVNVICTKKQYEMDCHFHAAQDLIDEKYPLNNDEPWVIDEQHDTYGIIGLCKDWDSALKTSASGYGVS